MGQRVAWQGFACAAYVHIVISSIPPIPSDTIDGEITTNACESFHAKFNANFSAPRPNIYVFIEVIKQTQVDVNALKNRVNITKQPNKFLKKKKKKNGKHGKKLSRNMRVKNLQDLNF